MNVSFVIPSDSINFKPFRNIPINILHLLTIIEEKFGNSVCVSVIDLRGVKANNIIYYVKDNDIFLYSLTTINYIEMVRTMKEIRKVYPRSKHIAGGIHVNLYPEECSKIFDSICIGEGDDKIINIIDDAKNNNLKKSYVEKKLLDVNLYPHPNRKFLPTPAIVETEILNDPYRELLGTSILLSRGCPFKCNFCANLIQSKPRFRTPELIEKEINYLKTEYKIESLAIKDDNILLSNTKQTEKILSAIGNTNLKWRGNCRANGISKEMVNIAKNSGCVDLAVGLESVCQNVLNNINKRINIEKSKTFFSYLNELNIGIRLNIIMGLPGEPKDIVEKTIKYVENTHPSSVLLSILTPIPGSEIYKNSDKFGIILDNNIDFSKLFNVFNRFGSDEEVLMSFKYKKITPFGESMTNETIINNYNELQSYLRSKNLTF